MEVKNNITISVKSQSPIAAAYKLVLQALTPIPPIEREAVLRVVGVLNHRGPRSKRTKILVNRKPIRTY